MKKTYFKILVLLTLGLIINTSCSSSSSSGDDVVIDDGDDTVTGTLHAAFDEFDTDNTTISLSGSTVTIEVNGRPNHTSPYWSPTHPLYVAPTVTNANDMAPGFIDEFNGSYTLNVPSNPVLSDNTTATGLGAIGFAVTGAVIYNDQEGPNVPIDNALPSLDYTGAHTGPQSYHYHIEPHAWSNDDGELIGIISDGFFLYGRRDYPSGEYPTDLDASGGHFGPTPHNPDGEYHYHIQNDLYLGAYYILFPGDYQGTPNNIN